MGRRQETAEAGENWVLFRVLQAWGAHPQIRMWRANTGVGWFANGKPARKTDPGAYPVKFGTPGQADITGLMFFNDGRAGGRRLEIECKAGNGKQSEEQVSFQRMIQNFGGLYILAYGLDDVDAALAAEGITR